MWLCSKRFLLSAVTWWLWHVGGKRESGLSNPYDISVWSSSDGPRSATCEYKLWMSCWSERLQAHYERQCYENPMKMSLIKNPGKNFSGPWIQIFHFDGLFFRPWIFYEKSMMVFMAHEIAMKYLALGFMSHEKFACYRFHGPWKLHSEISGVVKNEKW